MAISPNFADAHGALGVVLACSGRPKEGLAALKTCIRLDPRAPSLVYRLSQIAQALYYCREYAAAIEAARQESCTSDSALLEEIDELSRGRSSYIAANWLVGHALL
jgi:hypothetical protein